MSGSRGSALLEHLHPYLKPVIHLGEALVDELVVVAAEEASNGFEREEPVVVLVENPSSVMLVQSEIEDGCEEAKVL